MQTRYLGWIPLVAAFFLLFTCGAVHAEDAAGNDDGNKAMVLDEVRVTADKTAQKDIKKVSLSISAFSSEELDEYNISHIDQLTNLVPNVSYQKFGSHYTALNYRGMGGMTSMVMSWDTSLDGVTIPYIGLDTLYDLERVEVVRGGLGSVYGRNTHAGNVSLITKDPGPEFNSYLTATYGSFNTYAVTGAAGGPVSDKLGVRLAARLGGTDGFMENTYYDRDDTNDDTQISGRAKIVYTPGDNCDITFTFNAEQYESGYDSFTNLSNGATTDTDNNLLGHDDSTMLAPALTVKTRFLGMELTSITAYVDSTYDMLLDQDMSQYDILAFGYRETYQTLSQELRLASLDQSAAFQWMGGIFLMHQTSAFDLDFSFESMGSLLGGMAGLYQTGYSDVTTDNLAAFGQVQYTLWDRVELTAALRLDWERAELDWTGYTGLYDTTLSANHLEKDETWLALLPRFSAAYLLDQDQRIYGTIYRGYRPGAFAVTSLDLATIQNPVDPEYTLTYEVGYKAALLDKRLNLRTALFYVDWTDIQLSAVKDGVDIRQNAGEAHSMGVEAEITWLALPGLEFMASAGIMSAEIDEYNNHPSGEDQSGNDIPNTPSHKFAIGGTYRHTSGFMAQANAVFVGEKYMDEVNGYKQDPYTLLNAKLGYEAQNWAVYLWGRNLTDEAYVVRAIDFYSTGYYGRAGEPLAVGVELKLTF